jgi:hypothetical protein
MKLLLDQGLPRSAAKLLREAKGGGPDTGSSHTLYRRPEARGSFNGTAKPHRNSPSATTFMISQSNILRAVSRPNNGFQSDEQPRGAYFL